MNTRFTVEEVSSVADAMAMAKQAKRQVAEAEQAASIASAAMKRLQAAQAIEEECSHVRRIQ